MSVEKVQVFFDQIFEGYNPKNPGAAVLLIIGGCLITAYFICGMVYELKIYIKTRKEKKLFYETRKEKEYHRDE